MNPSTTPRRECATDANVRTGWLDGDILQKKLRIRFTKAMNNSKKLEIIDLDQAKTLLNSSVNDYAIYKVDLKTKGEFF